jgi:hypothetical protein
VVLPASSISLSPGCTSFMALAAMLCCVRGAGRVFPPAAVPAVRAARAGAAVLALHQARLRQHAQVAADGDGGYAEALRQPVDAHFVLRLQRLQDLIAAAVAV